MTKDLNKIKNGQISPIFYQFSVALDEIPIHVFNASSWQMVSQISDLSQHNILFLKSNAVQLILKPKLLENFVHSVFNQPIRIILCSTAVDQLSNNLTQVQLSLLMNYISYSDIILSCEIAGLGSWIECTQNGPSIDFSTLSLLPLFVGITAHPENPKFIHQLDLALAAATFDLEPTVLVLGDALKVLDKKYQTSSHQIKKLSSVNIYGASACLFAEDAQIFLKQKINQILMKKSLYIYAQNKSIIPDWISPWKNLINQHYIINNNVTKTNLMVIP